MTEGVERFVMRVADHRKESTGEQWSELHETPHPEGQWVRYSDYEKQAAEADKWGITSDAYCTVLIGVENVLKRFSGDVEIRAEQAVEALATVEAERDRARIHERQRIQEALGPNVRRVVEALETWLLDYADPDDGDWPERAEYVQAINDFRSFLDTLDPSGEECEQCNGTGKR